MKEIKDIISAYYSSKQQYLKTALATVVQVEGSSYRRPGARMLITEDGDITGAISGGCLEADVVRKALLAIDRQENKLITYNTTEEDNLMGVQVGCNGIVHILIEPIKDTDKFNPVFLIKDIYNKRIPAILVSIFSLDRKEPQPGTSFIYRQAAGEANIPAEYHQKIMPACHAALANKFSSIHVINEAGKELRVLIEYISPPLSLIIVGAGNDARPLSEMASMLGWNITLADGRRSHVTSHRFQKANKLIVSNADELLSKLDLDERTSIVLMTHNFNYDIAVLEQLLATQVSYIGILGPKEKLTRMLDDLSDKGVMLNEDQLSRLHGPVGLDIGAETAEEIAVSVIAEIQATFCRKTGMPLKNRHQNIHQRFPLYAEQE